MYGGLNYKKLAILQKYYALTWIFYICTHLLIYIFYICTTLY